MRLLRRGVQAAEGLRQRTMPEMRFFSRNPPGRYSVLWVRATSTGGSEKLP